MSLNVAISHSLLGERESRMLTAFESREKRTWQKCELDGEGRGRKVFKES